MRWTPKVIPILIAVIALDFALVFGFEAWRILSSPTLGLERLGFANTVYAIGKWAGLQTTQHLPLAAFFGVMSLAIAIMCSCHLATRIGTLRGHRISHDMLDAGLILIVVSTLVAATPAMLSGATEILIHERLPLWLVGLAATLSMIERLYEPEYQHKPGFLDRWVSRIAARRNIKPEDFVSPAMREGISARWDRLRDEAGYVVKPAPVKACGPAYSIYGR
ncbi:hypothetical protein [Pseudorhodoplanes sinuspersici]|uniref:Uncharacterized protein n=1 Tax=Pseudorhodoplanes sinuspersici TaxID=1235591 RepID=A0A1W6ZWN4_9HYPH|nr:hypothetical protein [Pseudorhodoplanes sinuspersici]ARQ01175.1 hypothetical protein CAK95_20295 [Pseudorhodoplanes sinuspersici]RKE72833.1 hypothetical protein DFP91_0706 [Pseudorhodoplanes sinuspersici]